MKSFFVTLLLSLLFGLSQPLIGSCGSASCPINIYRSLNAGWLSMSLSHEYIDQDRIYVGSTASYVGAIPGHHDEVRTLNERDILQLQIGIQKNADLSIEAPFVHRDHSHIEHTASGDLPESWNFTGLGDIIVAGHYAVLSPSGNFDPQVSVTAGLKLPTGVTNAVNSSGEAAEVTIQPGTGSLDGIVGLDYRQTVLSVPMTSGEYSALPLELGIRYQMNGVGTDKYRFGNIALVHLGTEYQFSPIASVLLQLNGKFQGFADVGNTGEPRSNTGGTWIFLSPGLGLQVLDGLAARAFVQVPVHQNVNGIQQTAPFNLLFGLSYGLKVFGG